MHLCAFPPPKINVIKETYANVKVNRTSGVLLLFGSFWKGWNVTLCSTFYVTTKKYLVQYFNRFFLSFNMVEKNTFFYNKICLFFLKRNFFCTK